MTAHSSSGYGRARLWLGVTAVGTIVVLSAAALLMGVPERLATLTDRTASPGAFALLLFFGLYALLHLPFDLMGGYVLPRRFGRTHPPLPRFLLKLLRGALAHLAVLMLFAFAFLLAAQQLGMIGIIGAGVLATFGLLVVRPNLAGLFAQQRVTDESPAPVLIGDRSLPATGIESEDEGFTGGFVGVIRPRRIILPGHWSSILGPSGLDLVRQRRASAVQLGTWRRGRLLALAFTWVGIIVAALLVGSDDLATAAGIIKFSLLFTLWSFLGLLILPTPSRAGVAEVDACVRASLPDDDELMAVVRRLDALQDGEPRRPRGVEMIFHPVPSVDSRSSLPARRGAARGFLDAARTSIFLSAAGLGLLGRAVHCNCGRPALWVFLPSD